MAGFVQPDIKAGDDGGFVEICMGQQMMDCALPDIQDGVGLQLSKALEETADSRKWSA